MSISGHPHEFKIYAMCQQAREDNYLITCYRKKKKKKKKIDDSFYASILLLTINFVITLSKRSADPKLIWQYYAKFMINNRTDNMTNWCQFLEYDSSCFEIINECLIIVNAHTMTPFLTSSVPLPQKYPSWIRPSKGGTSHDSLVAGTTSKWLAMR